MKAVLPGLYGAHGVTYAVAEAINSAINNQKQNYHCNNTRNHWYRGSVM